MKNGYSPPPPASMGRIVRTPFLGGAANGVDLPRARCY